MFKALRDKLRQAVSIFTRKVDEEAEEIQAPPEEAREETGKRPPQEVPRPEAATKREKKEEPPKKEHETPEHIKAEPLSQKQEEEKEEEKPGQQQKKQKKESAPETEKSSQKIPRKPVPAPEAGKSPHSILPREKPQEKHISSSLPVPSPQSLTQKPQKKEAAEKSAMHAPEPAPALSPASKEILEKKESRVQDESEEEKEITSLPPQQARKPSFFSKLKETFGKKEQVKAPEKAPESAPEPTPPASSEHDSEIPRGFFGSISDRISKKVLSEKQFEELFWELEVVMLENNVALEVIEKIKEDLARELVGKPLLRSKLEETVAATLKHSVESLFEVGEPLDLLARAAEKKPLVICFVGINGSGKTTTIAKLCHMFQKHHMSCVIAAGDTFRAAAIDQLQVHAQKLGVRLIKHDYGSDPAAVAFDAIAYAKANNKDVVLIDTAGRQHSNRNLMDELKKVKRVNNPDLIIFVGESITGNDCVEQAREFDAAVGINGIILTKADVDEKGGAAISVSYVTKKPILYLGMGQGYDDLKEFNARLVVEGLGLVSLQEKFCS